jgi:hypothetical protein
MFRYLRKLKGQSTLEYAVLIIIIIGALLSIQVYIKRGIQGRLKSATDDIGEQFSPGNTNAEITTKVKSVTRQVSKLGRQTTEYIGNESTNVITSMNIINVEQEFWGQI